MKHTLVSAILLTVTSLALGQSIERSAIKGYESIKASDLKAHVYVLASDSLEGRETAEPGQHKAATYIAGHFKKLGLKPLGANGSYLQPFDVEVVRLNTAGSSLTVNGASGGTFAWGNKFLSMSMKDTTVTGKVVFVGFTDTRVSPELRPKIAGRIVISLLGAKSQYGDTTIKEPMVRLFATRRDSGVTVLMSVAEDDGATSFSGIQTTLASIGMDKGSMRLKEAPGGGPRMMQQVMRTIIDPSLAQTILASTGMTIAQLRQKALTDSVFTPLFIDDMTLTITNSVIKETRTSENVAGLLEGSDARLKDQVVVFTGHYDHMGKTANGTIFYGADDDASGTSAVLELAEAFVKNGARPKRSVLFMTVAGEEKGLLGSSYYVAHPLLPLEKTVANLNTDMIGRMDTKYEPKNEPNYVYVIGSDKISVELDSLLKAANDQSVKIALDYTYNDENDPNQFYRRSDHYNFAKNGIPVVFYFTGTHPDYHKPTDTKEKLLYDRMASITRLIYLTGWKVAQLPHPLSKKADS